MNHTLSDKIKKLNTIMTENKATDEDIKSVRELIGRYPDGMHATVKHNKRIITVVSNTIIRKKPFPTLFWLVDRSATKKISAIESTGLIKELEKDTEIISLMKKDNEIYAGLRSFYHEQNNLPLTADSPFYNTIYKTGAGGLQDHGRIRCLHLHMAYHYSVGSSFGEYLTQRFPDLRLQ